MLRVLCINKSRLQKHRHNENPQIIGFLTNLVIVKHIKNVRTLLYACLLTVRVIKISNIIICFIK